MGRMIGWLKPYFPVMLEATDHARVCCRKVPAVSPVPTEPYPGLVQDTLRAVGLEVPPPPFNEGSRARRAAGQSLLPRRPLLVRCQQPNVGRRFVHHAALGGDLVTGACGNQPLAHALVVRGCPGSGRNASPVVGGGQHTTPGRLRRRPGLAPNRVAGLEMGEQDLIPGGSRFKPASLPAVLLRPTCKEIYCSLLL